MAAWREGCLLHGEISSAFRGTTHFPTHLDVNIPVPHFITHQQLCTAFKKDQAKAKKLASAFVLIPQVNISSCSKKITFLFRPHSGAWKLQQICRRERGKVTSQGPNIWTEEVQAFLTATYTMLPVIYNLPLGYETVDKFHVPLLERAMS